MATLGGTRGCLSEEEKVSELAVGQIVSMKFPVETLQQCWFIAGPTAVGKTALGIELAKQIDGEIVSLDSMAIYREMDIGTAKPDTGEQQQAKHHLIDLITPDEEYSTAQYVNDALSTCKTVLSRRKVPIFVGGTGLYLRAILRGVFEGPPADWEFRRKLEEETEVRGREWLHEQLEAVDPQTASKLHLNDVRRVVRALEIFHLTGQPASFLQNEAPLPAEQQPQHVYWLNPERNWLYERIDSRVHQMIELGLVGEVESLLARNPPIGRTARQALGYREIIDWLEGRVPSLETTIEKIQTGTRQFAKRQHTWFRNLEECRAIDVDPDSAVDQLIRKILS